MINLTAQLDTAEINRKMREVYANAKQMTSGVVTESEKMDIAMMRFKNTLISTAAQIGGGIGLFQLAKQIATTRGEFQQLEVAFKTLLQSEDKAKVLMSEMVTLAAKTPFDLQGVANGARQLLAYGFSAGEVTNTLTRLGNVAAGLGLPLERLTYLYGTTSVQGRLYARDMLQFTSSGIPLLQSLADMYGKSTEEINAMVSAGKIGFEDVKKVIEQMTNSGGKFYNLMQEQSKTINGQISNLGDSISKMFNEIGQSQEGAISGAISGAAYLVENYDKVLKILVPLVAAYGVYKASLIAVAAAQSAAIGVQYSEEIAELQKLLGVKEANKNADITAAVAKGTLKQAQAENIIAIRAEASARLDAMKIAAAQAAVSVVNAKESVVQSGYAISASRAKIAALREELITQTTAGEASKVYAIQEKINAELKVYGARQAALKSAQDQLSTAQTSAQNKAVAANTLQVQINEAATKSLTASQRLMTGVSVIATNAIRTLKASLASFLPMAIIAAVGMLVYKLYEVATAETEVEKAQTKLNKAIDEYNQKQDELKSKAEQLHTVMQDDVSTAYSKQKAYKSLITLYPELLKKYSEEKIKLISLIDLTKELNRINGIREEDNIEKQYNASLAKIKQLEQEKADKKGKDGVAYLDRTNKIYAEKANLNALKKQYDEFIKTKKEAEFSNSPAEVKIATFQGNIDELTTQNTKIDELIEEARKKRENNPGLFIPFNESEGFYQGQKQSNLQTIKTKQGEISTLQGEDKKTDGNKAYWEKQKKNAEGALAEMETSLKGTAKWNEIEAQIAKYDAEIQKYSVGNKGKANADALKLQQEITDAQIKNIFAAEKERIDALADGRAKELEQIELTRKAKIAAIDKEENDLKEKYKGKDIPKDQQDLYTARRDTAGADAKAQTTQVEAKYADDVKALYAQIGDVFLSEEERKRNGIKETYDEYRKQLKQKLDGGTITQKEYDVKLPEIDAAQKQAEIKPLLDQYASYTDQRKEIEKKFNDDIAALRTQAGEASTAEEANRLNAAADMAEQKMRESIASLDIKTLKDNINWDSVFGDLSKSSTSSISHTLEQVQQLFDLNKGNMSAEDIRDMTQAIEQMQDELAQRNPFGGLAQSFKAIGTAKDEVIIALNEYTESYSALAVAQNEYNAALSEQQTLEMEIEVGDLAADSEAYAQAKDKVAITADKQAKAEQRCVTAEKQSYTANNNLSRAYATFTSRLNSTHRAISKIGAGAKDLAEVFDSDVADKIGKALGFIDEVVGAATDVLGEIGRVSSTITVSISDTVGAASQGMVVASGVATTTMSTMEKASVILAVIGAALQIATAIAGLFNNDKAHQEEIDGLQERIKQLQWELDNMEVGRLKNNDVDILKKMRDAYAEATKEVLQLHAAEIARNGPLGRWFAFQKYQNEVLLASAEKLADAYAKVEYTKNKALGEAKYKEAQDALKNMAQQQLLLQRSIDEESEMKDVDTDQIADWERKMQEIGAEAIEMINGLVEDIIGGSSSEIAEDLGSAFIEAFQEGEDAAQAWGDKVNDIVADILKRMLIQQFLEGPLGEVFDKYKKKWFGNGEFSLNTVINSMDDFANDLMTKGDEFKDIWDNLPDNIKDMFKPKEDEDASQQEAASKGFNAMDQDTGNELNGRFTVMTDILYKSMIVQEHMREMGLNIADATFNIRDLAIIANNHLAAISLNTNEMYEMNRRLKNIEENTAYLK